MSKYLIKLLLVSSFLCCAAVAKADRGGANIALAEARAVLRAAERNGADRYAAIDLKNARDNLSKAKVDLEKRRWTLAERAARRASRDAELADAKTRAEKAERSLAELQSVVDTLKTELRTDGDES